MTINWDLANAVVALVRTDPAHFNMSSYTGPIIFDERGESCGATHCIAGWVIQLELGRTNFIDCSNQAARLLGADPDSDAYSDLIDFFLTRWTDRQRAAYDPCATPQERADWACDEFIALLKECDT